MAGESTLPGLVIVRRVRDVTSSVGRPMFDEQTIATLTAQFFNALTIGGIYALIALGYTMVYGIIELINFAHGDIFMVGAFLSFVISTSMGFTGPSAIRCCSSASSASRSSSRCR